MATIERAPISAQRPSALDGAVKPHIRYVDGMRGFAALFVMITHVSEGAFPHSKSLLLALLANNVHYAVTTFIVLSGYCLFLPIASNQGRMRQRIWSFYLSRARRILPPYYASMAFGVWAYERFQPCPLNLFLQAIQHHLLLRIVRRWCGCSDDCNRNNTR